MMSQDLRLIHGFHAVTARLRVAPNDVREVWLAAGRMDARAQKLLAAAQAAGVKVSPVETARLDALAPGARHQGVIAQVAAQSRHLTLDDVLDRLEGGEPALLLVLDGVTDPHNLGACLRVADGAGAQAVIAPKDRACGLNATVAKVASGAAETVPYIMVTNLARSMKQMQERGLWLIGADGAAEKEIYQIDATGPVAWVLGAEGSGLRHLTRQSCDFLARIPMHGAVESLNVSVAAGLCLFESRRQRRVS